MKLFLSVCIRKNYIRLQSANSQFNSVIFHHDTTTHIDKKLKEELKKNKINKLELIAIVI